MFTNRESQPQMRIPGGKSKNGGHASFGAIYRFSKQKKEVEIIVISYDPTVQSPIFEEDSFPEHPQGTLVREILEETNVQTYTSILLGTFPVEDNRPDVEDMNHVRHAYAIPTFDASRIRTEPLGFGRIGIPEWKLLSEVRVKIWKHHRWIIDFLDEYLLNPEVYTPKEFFRPVKENA